MKTLVHNSERQDEICQDIRDLRFALDTCMQRIVDLEALVRGMDTNGAAGAYLASRVDAALASPAQKPRTVIVALAAEMTAGMSDRSLVTHATRALAEFDADHAIFGASDSEIPFTFARYLAEPQPGPNVWGSAVTRRVHKMLDRMGVRPAVAAR